LKRGTKSERAKKHKHTFQTTELIHEAYLKIAGQNEPNRQNRAHFFGLAAQAMRHIPVDCARSKNSEKCGGLLVVSPAKVGLYWETCRTSHRMRGENSDFHQK